MNIILRIAFEKIPFFAQLLRKGILVEIERTINAKELLCKKLGIKADYIESEVQTIFLDGKPVDDINSILVRPGSTLALSAAMPGLVGVSFRKGSYYAPLRKEISYNEKAPKVPPDVDISKRVVIKCFNKVASDLGAALLENGVYITRKNFQDFLCTRFEDFQKIVKTVILNDRQVISSILQNIEWKEEKIFFQIEVSRIC